MSERIRKGYVRTPQGQLHYLRSGERGPHLCLFHTNPISAREFERALPLLGRSCRAIAFDTPGCGASDSPSEPISIAAYAQWMLAGIDALGIDRFAIGAHKTGSVIAADLYRQAGARVTHMALAGVPLWSAAARAAYRDRPEERLRPGRTGGHVVPAWRSVETLYGEAADIDLITIGFVGHLRAWEQGFWPTAAIMNFDLAAALAAVRAPLLFLSPNDVTRREHLPAETPDFVASDRAAAARLGAAWRHFPNANPPLPWSAPADYAREVLAFIGAGQAS